MRLPATGQGLRQLELELEAQLVDFFLLRADRLADQSTAVVLPFHELTSPDRRESFVARAVLGERLDDGHGPEYLVPSRFGYGQPRGHLVGKLENLDQIADVLLRGPARTLALELHRSTQKQQREMSIVA